MGGLICQWTYLCQNIFDKSCTSSDGYTFAHFNSYTQTQTDGRTLHENTPPDSCSNSTACNIDSTIDIENTTGGSLTLDLKGPTKFHFVLGGGTTTLNVCSGSYSYKAWGCGGATDTGTIK